MLHKVVCFLVFFTLGSIYSTTLSAQMMTVPVRTGEHAEFTRVVIPLPENTLWRFQQTGRIATLSIIGESVNFDITQSFNRIPRTRLDSLQVSKGVLEMKLACDCMIRAAQDLPQFVVLDILNPPVKEATSEDRIESTETVLALESALRAGRLLAQSLSQTNPSISRSEKTLTLPVLSEGQDLEVAAANKSGSPEANSAPALSIGAVIAEAVSQGLLRPVSLERGRASVHRDDDAQAKGDEVNLLADKSGHLSASTSIARARGEDFHKSSHGSDVKCLSPDILAPSLWFNSIPGPIDLSLEKILTDTDEVDQAALVHYARHYIYWGFGKEARLLLNLETSDSPEHRLLAEISYLVDLEAAPSKDIENYSGCGTSEALWAFLSILPDTPAPEFPLDLALQGAISLPEPLRSHLGEHILAHIHSIEGTENASALEDALTTFQKIGLPAFDHKKSDEPTQSSIVDIPQLEHTIAILQNADRLGKTLSEQDTTEALALKFVSRNSTESAKLSELLIRSAIRAGDFEFGLGLLVDPDAMIPPTIKNDLRRQIFLSAAADGDDMQFLRIVFAQNLLDIPSDAQTSQAIAKRLAVLGFDEVARSFLERGAQSSAAPEIVSDDDSAPVLTQEGGASVIPGALPLHDHADGTLATMRPASPGRIESTAEMSPLNIPVAGITDVSALPSQNATTQEARGAQTQVAVTREQETNQGGVSSPLEPAVPSLTENATDLEPDTTAVEPEISSSSFINIENGDGTNQGAPNENVGNRSTLASGYEAIAGSTALRERIAARLDTQQ